MTSSFVTVHVRLKGRHRRVALYPSIPVEEVQRCLQAAFQSASTDSASSEDSSAPDTSAQALQSPVALRDRKKKTYYPLSCVCADPSYFQKKVYDLVLDPRTVPSPNHTISTARSTSKPRVKHESSSDSSDSEVEDEKASMTVDLSDFDFETLVQIFTKATSSNAIDKSTYYQCIDRILSEFGRYDRLTRASFGQVFELFQKRHPASSKKVHLPSLLAGLAAFTSGDKDVKIRILFDLFDPSQHASLTLSQLTTLISSVFLAVQAFWHTPSFDPQAFAQEAASHCLSECGNRKQRVSFEDFCQWYKSGSVLPFFSSALHLTLPQIAHLTGLDRIPPRKLLQVFDAYVRQSHESASGVGELTKEDFKACCAAIGGRTDACVEILLDGLFNAFDIDGTGVVDLVELSSGLSILCAGPPESKLEAAFALFDADADGYITKTEMQAYLTAVYTVVFATDKHAQTQMPQMTPSRLAELTTAQAFVDADMNADEKLSLEEFQRWYMGSTIASSGTTELNLGPPDRVFDTVASYSDEEGMLSKSVYYQLFATLIPSPSVNQLSVLQTLFHAFKNEEDKVDVIALACGLSALCDGSQDEKTQAAFELMDVDGDGRISPDELQTYFASVFTVLFATSSGTSHVSPKELASVTTQDVLKTARSDSVTFQQLKDWYSSSSPTDVKSSLLQLRQQTGLDQYDASSVLPYFRAHANDENVLTQSAFLESFKKLNGKTDEPVLLELFELFDQDADGRIDALEMSAGLSILCGGDKQERADSLFQLYDSDGDGYVSREEMQAFLRAVFKVLYKVSPELKDQTHCLPEELAKETMEECFRQFDVNQDDQLSREEFGKWVRTEDGQDVKETSFTIGEITSMLRLHAMRPHELYASLQAHVSDVSNVRVEEMGHLMEDVAVEKNDERLETLANEIGKMYAHDGIVDLVQVVCGFSVLCGGSSEDRVADIFQLFDTNGTGMRLEDMSMCLTSVFKMLFYLYPSYAARVGVDAEELGKVTAAEAFHDRGVGDTISLEEFQVWYRHETEQPSVVAKDNVNELTLETAKKTTRLTEFAPNEVFAALASRCSDDGLISKTAFDECVQELLKDVGEDAAIVLDRVFYIFEVEEKGYVDYSELCTGLSVLCRGSPEEKARAAFNLFDLNGDGGISFQEMAAYLTSVFKVLYATTSGLQEALSATPEELGVVLTRQCFQEADVDEKLEVSFDDFVLWYTQSSGMEGPSALLTSELVLQLSPTKPEEEVEKEDKEGGEEKEEKEEKEEESAE